MFVNGNDNINKITGKMETIGKFNGEILTIYNNEMITEICSH